MNLPNKLTVLRLILSVVIIILLVFPFYMVGIEFPRIIMMGVGVSSLYMVAGVIFIIASITDFLDGYIARKYNLITNTGKMLDAIADKVLVNSVLILLASAGYIHVIIPVVVVLRDIIVNAIKMEAASKGVVVAAIGSGKLKTAALMIGIVLAMFGNMPFEAWNLKVDEFLLYFAAIMSIVSLVQYYNANKNILFNKKNDSNTII